MSNPTELLQAAKYALNTEEDTKRATLIATQIVTDHPDSVEAERAQELLDGLGVEVPIFATERQRTGASRLIFSTTDDVDGFQTVRNLGVVMGSSVRSRHLGSDMAASLKAVVGGELKGVTKLISDGRTQALERLCQEAESRGANAVKGLRFSTSQVWEGAAEIMAYGTAIVVKPNKE